MKKDELTRSLLGEWRTSDISTIVLKDDGSVKCKLAPVSERHGVGKTWLGSYSVIGGTITFSENLGLKSGRISLKGNDTLILHYEDGGKSIWKKELCNNYHT